MNYLGSVKTIKIIPVSEFISKHPTDPITKNDVQNLKWETLGFVDSSASFEQNAKDTDMGTVYSSAVKCEIAGVEKSGEYISGRYYIIWLQDMNGTEMTVGRKSCPLQLSVNATVPKSVTSRPGLQLSFRGDQFLPAEII